MNDKNAAVARLLGYRTLNELRMHDHLNDPLVVRDIPDYTSDVGAAMGAVLAMGYLPHIEKTRTLNHDTGQFEYVLAVGLDDGNFVSYIDSVQQTHEITQAIAAALVDALLAAEEV